VRQEFFNPHFVEVVRSSFCLARCWLRGRVPRPASTGSAFSGKTTLIFGRRCSQPSKLALSEFTSAKISFLEGKGSTRVISSQRG